MLFRCFPMLKLPVIQKKRLLDVRYDAFSSSKYPLKDISSQGYRDRAPKLWSTLFQFSLMEITKKIIGGGVRMSVHVDYLNIKLRNRNHVVTSFWLLISLPEIIYGQKFIILLHVAVLYRFIFENNVQKIHWVEKRMTMSIFLS